MMKYPEILMEEHKEFEEKLGEKLIASYVNGNHITSIYDGGTKIRETLDPSDETMTFDFAESVDVKITEKCDGKCPFCFEGSNKDGRHGCLNLQIYDTWEKGTEICIGGGNPFLHPDLDAFLVKMKEKGVISNITINQRHIKDNLDRIRNYAKNNLLYGIGVSVTDPFNKGEMDDIMKLESIVGNKMVLHIIAGVFPMDNEAIQVLAGRHVLILGYANVRAGRDYYRCNSEEIEGKIQDMKDNLDFLRSITTSLSFDTTALEQLEVKDTLKIDNENWKTIFQGNDEKVEFGIYPNTMYFDSVKGLVFSSSHTEEDGLPYLGQSFRDTWRYKCSK